VSSRLNTTETNNTQQHYNSTTTALQQQNLRGPGLGRGRHVEGAFVLGGGLGGGALAGALLLVVGRLVGAVSALGNSV